MKEIWSIDLETSLVGLTFDGLEFYWQTMQVVGQMN